MERCLISTASLGSENLANKAEGCYGHVHSKEHHFHVITFSFLYFFIPYDSSILRIITGSLKLIDCERKKKKKI